MRSPSCVCILCIVSLASICLSKTDTWKVGAIPGGEAFLVLTPMEHRLDSILEESHRWSLERIANGSAYRGKYPDSVLRRFLQREKDEYRSPRDNRARFRIRSERNGKPDPEGMFRDTALPPMLCSCVLTENGVARLQAGMWVFDGFKLQLELDSSERIRSWFWEDQHKRAPFKRSLADTSLRDDVLVENVGQELQLAKPLRFVPGQMVVGRLAFRATPYFRSSEFRSWVKEGGYSDAIMDTIRTAGTMDFICQLKACPPADSATRWSRTNERKWSDDPCR